MPHAATVLPEKVKYFNVLKSNTTGSFNVLGTVQSSASNNYSFDDIAANSGSTQYQIIGHAKTGSDILSNTVAVAAPSNVYYVSTNGHTSTLHYSCVSAQDLVLTVRNIQGAMVQQELLAANTYSKAHNLYATISGTYTIELRTRGGMLVWQKMFTVID
jgi:hypothetical protein